MTAVQQLLDRQPMQLDPLALDHRCAIPGQAQPAEAIENVVGELLLAALPIGVFYAQQELATVVTGEQPVENRRAGRADVQAAGGAGGQADANRPWG